MAVKRTGVDEMLVRYMAAGRSQAWAARKLKLSPKTVQRRMAEPEFVNRVCRARREMIGRTTGQLVALAPLAVKTLHDLLGPEKSERTRAGAAKAALAAAYKAHADDLLEQMAKWMEEAKKYVESQPGPAYPVAYPALPPPEEVPVGELPPGVVEEPQPPAAEHDPNGEADFIVEAEDPPDNPWEALKG
jgi:hypothetical protein